MPSRRTTVAPFPQRWLERVVSLLEDGGSKKVHWSLRAQMDWQQFGMAYEALDLCLRVLRTPGMVGQKIDNPDDPMTDPRDDTLCETWAFLCPHPQPDLKRPIYAKIGLHRSRSRINIYSMHTDNTGTLLKAIRSHRDKNS